MTDKQIDKAVRAATIPPKPRRTAGEKLAADLSDAWGTNDFPDNPSALQSLAIKRGYIDDPEPKTDGELFEQAWLHSRVDNGRCITNDWQASAAEFLRLLAERDGGAT